MIIAFFALMAGLAALVLHSKAANSETSTKVKLNIFRDFANLFKTSWRDQNNKIKERQNDLMKSDNSANRKCARDVTECCYKKTRNGLYRPQDIHLWTKSKDGTDPSDVADEVEVETESEFNLCHLVDRKGKSLPRGACWSADGCPGGDYSYPVVTASVGDSFNDWYNWYNEDMMQEAAILKVVDEPEVMPANIVMKGWGSKGFEGLWMYSSRDKSPSKGAHVYTKTIDKKKWYLFSTKKEWRIEPEKNFKSKKYQHYRSAITSGNEVGIQHHRSMLWNALARTITKTWRVKITPSFSKSMLPRINDEKTFASTFSTRKFQELERGGDDEAIPKLGCQNVTYKLCK